MPAHRGLLHADAEPVLQLIKGGQASLLDRFEGLAELSGTGSAAVMVCGPRRGGKVHDLLALAGLGAPEIGEVSRARAPCEKLLAYASPLLDPHTGRHLGSFPRPSRTWR